MRLISAVEFIDKAIPLNEKGEPWKLSPYQRRVTVSELFKEPLIMRGTISGSTTSSGLLKSLQDHGLKFKIGARFDAPFAVKAAVKDKMGIGLLFLDSVRNHVKDGEFKILIGHGLKLEGRTYIIYLKDKPLSRLGQEFLELLHSARPKKSIFNRETGSRCSLPPRCDPTEKHFLMKQYKIFNPPSSRFPVRTNNQIFGPWLRLISV